MPFARNGSTRLYWRLDGEGSKPPLLLLNSIGTDLSIWDRALPHLMENFSIVRMDTRGHGASDAPPGDYALDMLAQDAAAVMDAAGIASAVLCGVSLGAMVAMTLADARPARIDALVLACTSAQMDPSAWQARIDAVRTKGMGGVAEMALQRFLSETFRRNHPEVAETVRSGLLATDAEGYAGCCAAIRDMALSSKLAHICAPTLVVAGAHDVSTPFAGHGDKIAAAICGAQTVTLDTAHLANVEAPAAFAAAVGIFARHHPGLREANRTLYEAGLSTRRAVLGDAWVDRSLAGLTPFNADFQAMITRYAWHEIWNRPGLDRRTRRLVVIAITVALGRWEEFRLHVRAGLERGGFTEDELKETLMQSAIYAGVPAANTAFAEAANVMREMIQTPPADGKA